MPAVEQQLLGQARPRNGHRRERSLRNLSLSTHAEKRGASASLQRNARFASTCADRAVDVLDQGFESLLVVEPVVRGLPAHSVAEQVRALREHCRAAVFSDTQGFHRRHLVGAGLCGG